MTRVLLPAGIRSRIDVGANGVYPQEVAATVYLCVVAAFERLVTGTTAAIGVREENGTLAFEIVAEDAGVDPADANLNLAAPLSQYRRKKQVRNQRLIFGEEEIPDGSPLCLLNPV